MSSLRGALSNEISEEEATVFWGLLVAAKSERNYANVDEILESTNTERAKLGLDPLTKGSLVHSLLLLNELGSYSPVDSEGNFGL